jgi:FtsZ-binding cell division protein ZapB
MNKEEAIAKINESDNVDFEVFSKDEHKTYLENFKKSEVEPGIKTATSEIHKRYDDDLFELFGERKETTEKTYDFLKRKFSDLNEKAKGTEPLQTKIKELEEALKNDKGNEHLKNELQQVRDQYKQEKETWDNREKELLSNLDQHKLETELDKAMVGLKFNDDLPEDLRETFINKVKNDLSKSARIVEGKMIFVDDQDKTLVNKDNAFNPFTAKEMMEKNLESILDKKKEQPGLKKPQKKIVDGKEVLDLPNPNAKSRPEVTQYLKEAGISQRNPEYMKLYKEFTKDIPAVT